MINIVRSGVPEEYVYEADQAPVQTMLYDDIMTAYIMPKLALSDQGSIVRVCKAWNYMLQQKLDEQLDKIQQSKTFGKAQWLCVPGVTSVSDEPEWTIERKNWLKAKLTQKCQFFNEPDKIQPHRFQNDKIKRTYQTVMVIFFPEKINDEPVDINLIGQLFSFEKTENTQNNPGTVFEYITGNNPNDAYRTEKATRSYFAAVTLDVIPHSRKTLHQTKVDLLTPKGCRVPTPLEAVISNVVMNLDPSQEKKGFFFGREGGDWWTYTATDKLFDGHRLVVGAAGSAGPEVGSYYDGSSSVGVAAVAEVL